jgi:RNA polymerase sigma-70 factor (ECF subfamily)
MNAVNELIPTRRSLLDRLKQWNDQESWKVFFDTEAQDVVQETVMAVLKSMPTFEYETKDGSFKSWLLQLTRWRISDQLRRREPGMERPDGAAGTSAQMAEIDLLVDPAAHELETAWDREWETNLMEAAIEKVKRKVRAEDYQVFDLYVFKEWPVSRVARTLHINPGKVYLVKHRIGNLIKKEVNRLRERSRSLSHEIKKQNQVVAANAAAHAATLERAAPGNMRGPAEYPEKAVGPSQQGDILRIVSVNSQPLAPVPREFHPARQTPG